MVVVAKPLVQAASSYRRWMGTAVAVVSVAVAATTTGLALALLGSRAGVPQASGVLAISLVALVYSLRELGVLRLPVPSSWWQVPRGWVRGDRYASTAVFGGLLGLGFLTRVPFFTFHVLLAVEAVSGRPAGSALLGAIFGLARGGTVVLVGRIGRPVQGDAVPPDRWIMLQENGLHVANGIVLAFVGAYGLSQTLAG